MRPLMLVCFLFTSNGFADHETIFLTPSHISKTEAFLREADSSLRVMSQRSERLASAAQSPNESQRIRILEELTKNVNSALTPLNQLVEESSVILEIGRCQGNAGDKFLKIPGSSFQEALSTVREIRGETQSTFLSAASILIHKLMAKVRQDPNYDVYEDPELKTLFLVRITQASNRLATLTEKVEHWHHADPEKPPTPELKTETIPEVWVLGALSADKNTARANYDTNCNSWRDFYRRLLGSKFVEFTCDTPTEGREFGSHGDYIYAGTGNLVVQFPVENVAVPLDGPYVKTPNGNDTYGTAYVNWSNACQKWISDKASELGEKFLGASCGIKTANVSTYRNLYTFQSEETRYYELR